MVAGGGEVVIDGPGNGSDIQIKHCSTLFLENTGRIVTNCLCVNGKSLNIKTHSMKALEKYCRVKGIKRYIFQFHRNMRGTPSPCRVGGEHVDTAGVPSHRSQSCLCNGPRLPEC